ncbi:hypothetical protein Rhe02_59050 [Rhizocola hellebori]|uniref:Leucine-rich repeat domain-containing protein n=1 Tax=Rhizocola hellebori TaxID=1392758 RepID=A0A8J3QDT3_9ACTN|nr:hypothetical protein [Rhizocola hellebori]GIH07838.1 hypothetical protein Rhe02_59050 [Rhizocola hellebori]
MGDLSKQPRSVEIDFGAGPAVLNAGIKVLDLRAGRHGIVPADGPVRWDGLDALPQLLTVMWAGPGRGIVEAVAAHPGIRFLYWSDAEGDIDLRATRLGTVCVDGLKLRSVRLPACIESLSLGSARANFGAAPPTATVSGTLRIDAPDAGHRLDLRLFHYGADVVIPQGVRRASSLWVWVGGEISAAVLSTLTDLETLTITFDHAPGTITDLEALGRLTTLRSLQLDEAYGLTVEELPELPALQTLELNGTRRTTAAAVKARYRGSAVGVRVSGAKTDEWLALHMDNPFRDWIEDSKGFGKAACLAYNRARQAADAERALRGLVADLNTLHDKYEMIDTLRREQAWDAYCGLARQLEVPAEQAESWFDDERRF